MAYSQWTQSFRNEVGVSPHKWCKWCAIAIYRIPEPYFATPLQPEQWFLVVQHPHAAPLAPLNHHFQIKVGQEV